MPNIVADYPVTVEVTGFTRLFSRPVALLFLCTILRVSSDNQYFLFLPRINTLGIHWSAAESSRSLKICQSSSTLFSRRHVSHGITLRRSRKVLLLKITHPSSPHGLTTSGQWQTEINRQVVSSWKITRHLDISNPLWDIGEDQVEDVILSGRFKNYLL